MHGHARAFGLCLGLGLAWAPLEPAARAITPADLRPQGSGSNNSELWSFLFQFNGDVQLGLNLSRASLPTGSVCGSDLSVMGFRGKSYMVAREYGKDNFAYTPANQGVRVHAKIWFEGNLPDSQHVHFATSKAGHDYFVDLTLTGIRLGQAPEDAARDLGGDRAAVWIIIPYAKAKGRVAVDGDTMAVEGTGYLDHSFQSDFIPKLFKRGFRYAAHRGAKEVGYVLAPRGGGTPVGYGLREEGGTWKLRSPVEVKPLADAKARGVDVPTILQIRFADGSQACLRRDGDKQRLSLLGEFNWATRKTLKLVMGGELWSFKGMGSLDGSGPMLYNFFVVED